MSRTPVFPDEPAVLVLKIPEMDKEELHQMALKQDRSMSAVARILIREGIARERAKQE